MSPRTTSRAFQTDSVNEWLNVFFLMLLGFFALLIRERLNIPLKLPGHHGIEFMMLFMAGKLITRQRYAMSFSSVGASVSSLFPFFHFGNPFMPLTLLLPGIIGDFVLKSRSKSNYLFIALAGGLAYAAIPIFRQLITLVTGMPFGSLLGGWLYPVALHFIFGATGALLGAFISKPLTK